MRITLLALCFFLFPSGSFSQESIQTSYERNFLRASLPAKTSVLIDAATDERSGEFMGPLYEFALQFALANAAHLRDDPDMILLVSTAANGAASVSHNGSVGSLLRLLDVFRDSYSRVEILGALAVLGRGNTLVINNVNQFLLNQNDSFRSGMAPELPVLRASISALGSLGDESSFPVLFSTLTASYPQAVIQDTLRALDSIGVNQKDYLVRVIQDNPLPEKAVAFRMGAYSELLSPGERGEIAQAALQAALAFASPSNDAADSLRYDAVRVLTRLRWSPASTWVVQNFYRVQRDFNQSLAPRERFLEAIDCMGVMGSSEAAQALALTLGFINSQAENNGGFDEAVVLAIINALGELGDKSAFDYLLYVSYLNYPDTIQSSAREALNRLQW